MQLLKYGISLKYCNDFYLTQYLKNCTFSVSQSESYQTQIPSVTSIQTNRIHHDWTAWFWSIQAACVSFPNNLKLSNDKLAYSLACQRKQLILLTRIGGDQKRQTSSCTLACLYLCHSPCNETFSDCRCSGALQTNILLQSLLYTKW